MIKKEEDEREREKDVGVERKVRPDFPEVKILWGRGGGRKLFEMPSMNY